VNETPKPPADNDPDHPFDIPEGYEITSATPILTPYHRAGQETKIVGWSLGLRRKP